MRRHHFDPFEQHDPRVRSGRRHGFGGPLSGELPEAHLGPPFQPPGGFPGFPGGFPPMPPRPFNAEFPSSRRRGHGHGRGGRARRGNVRAALLALLAERPMHGYEMIQEIVERSHGFWRPSPGSVYPTLQLLADMGLVTTEEGTAGKRLYSLTETGRTEADKQDKTRPWEQVVSDIDPNEGKLRWTLGQLMTAVAQISQAASSEQKARAAQALDEARQKLYLILAEAGVDPVEDTIPDTDEDPE